MKILLINKDLCPQGSYCVVGRFLQTIEAGREAENF